MGLLLRRKICNGKMYDELVAFKDTVCVYERPDR